MALTRSSVLHYWSARYGMNPRIGGRPAYARNSAAAFVSQEGEVDAAIVNTPRFDWETINLPNSQTERRKVLTLELARTNLNTLALGGWTVDGASITTGQSDPAWGTAAAKITYTGGNARIYSGASFGSNGVKAILLGIAPGNAAASTLRLFDVTATVTRCQVTVTWTNGVPSGVIVAGAGTIFPVRQLANGFYLFAFASNGVVSANVNRVEITPDNSSTGKFIYVYRPTFEDGPFATSFLDPATARATDICYWNFTPLPQALMLYVRFVEQGTVVLGSPLRLLSISSSAGANPELSIAVSSGFYSAYQNSMTSVLAAVPNIGDTVELVMLVQSGGNVQIIQSLNGAGVSSGSLSGASALPPAWSDQKLWLNSEGTVSFGATRFADVRLVKYADVVASTTQGIMDELRGFELGPNGDVL